MTHGVCKVNISCEVCDNSFGYDIATDMTEKPAMLYPTT